MLLNYAEEFPSRGMEIFSMFSSRLWGVGLGVDQSCMTLAPSLGPHTGCFIVSNLDGDSRSLPGMENLVILDYFIRKTVGRALCPASAGASKADLGTRIHAWVSGWQMARDPGQHATLQEKWAQKPMCSGRGDV